MSVVIQASAERRGDRSTIGFPAKTSELPMAKETANNDKKPMILVLV
jgi:hypothetical protein